MISSSETDDIDRWLAENLMGWTNVVLKRRRNSKSLIGTPPDARFISMGVTHFSSSWATAWPVVKTMWERGWLLQLSNNTDGHFSATFRRGRRFGRTGHDTNPAMAVCFAAKAALEAKEV